MQQINLITRRGFLDRGIKIGLGVTLSTLVDIPFVLRQALAEGTIGTGTPKKKVLFIFLRGANDSLNSVVPILDDAYVTSRPLRASDGSGGAIPNIGLRTDSGLNYATAGQCDFIQSGTGRTFPQVTIQPGLIDQFAIRLGNGFAALHPALKFLAPGYNAGHLALVHRVAYPRQSRSHFDSQNYWETASPNNNLVKDGIFYRTAYQGMLAAPDYFKNQPLTGVSIQSSLPLSLRGSAAAMTNLSDVSRYDLLNIPNSLNSTNGTKADAYITSANQFPFVTKDNRELLQLQYGNLLSTLPLFTDISNQLLNSNFKDNENTDGDYPYSLFPTSNNTNGGYVRGGGVTDANKYVVDTSSATYSLFNSLKAAALVLNNTDAFIAGTQYDGFDNHKAQGGATGTHANLLKSIGWAMYALRKYFMINANKCSWDDLIVVTMTEFGRTTVMNSDLGTDHAEAGVMFIGGGKVKGYDATASRSGVFGCSPNQFTAGSPLNWTTGGTGSMFGASGRYLKRIYDYRSVLGKIIRDHVGATQTQLNQIIPGYPTENLGNPGTAIDNTPVAGEPDIV